MNVLMNSLKCSPNGLVTRQTLKRLGVLGYFWYDVLIKCFYWCLDENMCGLARKKDEKSFNWRYQPIYLGGFNFEYHPFKHLLQFSNPSLLWLVASQGIQASIKLPATISRAVTMIITVTWTTDYTSDEHTKYSFNFFSFIKLQDYVLIYIKHDF